MTVSSPGYGRGSTGPFPVLEIDRVFLRLSPSFALEDVSLRVDAGTIMGLIGPNGSGKTTLLNAVSGLLAVQEGEIRLLGRRIDGRPLHRISRLGLGRTFQHVRVPSALKVWQVLGLAGRSGSRSLFRNQERDREAIRNSFVVQGLLAGFEGFDLETGLEAKVGDLSFGQAKVVSIAASMLGGPRLLLLDEPLAGLHRDQVERVSRFISDWRLETESCVLIVDHNLPALSDLAGSIAVLDGGRVLDQGTPDEILSKPEVREVFFV